MPVLLIASLLVTGAFEAGGRVGIVFPASGLERYHSDAAEFGVELGYRSGPSRLLLNYAYAGLNAKEASPYRFDIHDLSLGYGYDFVVGRPSPTSQWGFDAAAAGGLSLLKRTFGDARETGKSPSVHLDAGLFQRQGHSRLSFGLDNVVFVESRSAGSTSNVSLTYVIALKGGVTYVF